MTLLFAFSPVCRLHANWRLKPVECSGVIDETEPAAACQIIILKHHESRRLWFYPRLFAFNTVALPVMRSVTHRPSRADPGSRGPLSFPTWTSGCTARCKLWSEDVSPLERTDYSSYLKMRGRSENKSRMTRPHTAVRRGRRSRLSVFLPLL